MTGISLPELSQYRIVGPTASGPRGVYDAERKSDGAAVWIRFLPNVLAHDASLLERLRERLAALTRYEGLQVPEVFSQGEIAFSVLYQLKGTTLKAGLANGPFRSQAVDASYKALLSEDAAHDSAEAAIEAGDAAAPERGATGGPVPELPVMPNTVPLDPVATGTRNALHSEAKSNIIPPAASTPVPTSNNVRTLQVGEKTFEWDASPPPWESQPDMKLETDPAALDLASWPAPGFFPVGNAKSTVNALVSALAIYYFVQQVLAALQRMHAAGMVHGQLNPANIFIGEWSTIQLTNVEACVLRELSIPADEAEAQVDVVAYQSPEQIVGRTLDARSDLFSLGSILFEMATRTRAFSDDTVEELRHSIARRENLMGKTLPSTSNILLDGVIGKALERDRGMRYKTAGEMLAAIAPLVEGVEHGLRDIKQAEERAKQNAEVAQPSATAEAEAGGAKKPIPSGVNFRGTTSDIDRLKNLSPLARRVRVSAPAKDPPRLRDQDPEVDTSKLRYSLAHPRVIATGLAVIGAAIVILLVLYFSATWRH